MRRAQCTLSQVGSAVPVHPIGFGTAPRARRLEAALPLPRGQRDIPLMIGDRVCTEDGSFRYPSIDPSLRGEPGVAHQFMEGVLGDVILVNSPVAVSGGD